MVTWFKRFLTDETAFIGLVRAAFLGLGALVINGSVPALAEHTGWGAAIMAIGGFIRAGDRNAKES